MAYETGKANASFSSSRYLESFYPIAQIHPISNIIFRSKSVGLPVKILNAFLLILLSG